MSLLISYLKYYFNESTDLTWIYLQYDSYFNTRNEYLEFCIYLNTIRFGLLPLIVDKMAKTFLYTYF